MSWGSRDCWGNTASSFSQSAWPTGNLGQPGSQRSSFFCKFLTFVTSRKVGFPRRHHVHYPPTFATCGESFRENSLPFGSSGREFTRHVKWATHCPPRSCHDDLSKAVSPPGGAAFFLLFFVLGIMYSYASTYLASNIYDISSASLDRRGSLGVIQSPYGQGQVQKVGKLTLSSFDIFYRSTSRGDFYERRFVLISRRFAYLIFLYYSQKEFVIR